MIHCPLLRVNVRKLTENIRLTAEICHAGGIFFCAVIKAYNGRPEIARLFRENGADSLGTSRLGQIEACRRNGIPGPYVLVRIPMISLADETVRLADVSLNSESATLDALEAACERQNRRHGVILMTDLGDLREGAWTKEELASLARHTEFDLSRLDLLGIGVNLGCYGTVRYTPDKMEELVQWASAVEKGIGHPLQVISGGSTLAFPMVENGTMPGRINELRIGGGPLIPTNWSILSPERARLFHRDVFTLEAEVVEVRTKATYPRGELLENCFGDTVSFTDRGDRRRAIVAVGRQDLGTAERLKPRECGVAVLGASSDHTILDIEDYPREIQVGDVLGFDILYENLLYLTGSADVAVVLSGKDGEEKSYTCKP